MKEISFHNRQYLHLRSVYMVDLAQLSLLPPTKARLGMGLHHHSMLYSPRRIGALDLGWQGHETPRQATGPALSAALLVKWSEILPDKTA